MEDTQKTNQGIFSEDNISMLLGLAIVIVVGAIIFNWVQRSKGSVNVPGVVTEEIESGSKVDPVSGEVVGGSEGSEYEVVRGDNLWKIAEKELGSGYRWSEIANLNNMGSSSIIEVGQRLRLPSRGEVVTKSGDIKQPTEPVISSPDNQIEVAPDTYTVKKGDSLWKISLNTYGDGYQWVNVWNLNKNIIANPDKIEIGMTLKMPQIGK